MSTIEIREARDVATQSALCDLIEDVWEQRLVIPELLRAIAHAGGYVAGAHRGDELVAASVAFLARSDAATLHLHSHITGVATAAQGRGVGYLVKQHQRRWCLERDIHAIEWTFDPAIARNAWFNLQRLGADVVAFVPDFYGDGDDRFVVRWALDDAAARPEPVVVPDDRCVPIDERLRVALAAASADGFGVVGVTRAGVYVLRQT